MKLTAKQRHALYKFAAAECFIDGGPKLTPELAREAYGSYADTMAERIKIMLELVRLKLLAMDQHKQYRLTEAGRAAINYVPQPKTKELSS